MKTVVLVWKQGYFNHTTTNDSFFWGIGDMLRGAYGMFNLSKKMNFKLIVDYSLHPIAACLQNSITEFSPLVAEKKNEIPLVYPIDKVIDHINSKFQESDITMLYTNLAPDELHISPSPELKEFIKNLLIPNSQFQSYINTKLASIPYSEFSVLHYRLGDDEIVRNNLHNRERFIGHLLMNKRTNDILLSDSDNFKQNIQNSKIDICMFNEPICHIGVHSEKHAIQHTLFELILLSKAKSIQSYNTYGWISGFVHIISIIYDIPLKSQINV